MIERQAVWSQSTGRCAFRIMTDSQPGDLDLIGTGWAGCGVGKNNPAMESVHNLGPLPLGRYRITPPASHPTVGPYAMRLTAEPGNEMHGRDGFLCHGPAADPLHRGQESHGCPILARAERERLWSLRPDVFLVIP